MRYEDDLAQAVEIIPEKLSFVALRRPDGLSVSPIARKSLCFSIDNELLFEPFFAEFGPLNLGLAYRFCEKLTSYLKEGEKTGRHVYFYCSSHPHQVANASVLLGMYQVLVLGRSTEEAYSYLSSFKPFVPFRDASCGVSTFHLTVYDCITGIQKARDVGFLNFTNDTFDVQEYQYYERVEHGDLNWIIPGKFVAFGGPASKTVEHPGSYRSLVPEDYLEYFKHKGVTGIVRLNNKVYDRRRFTSSGFHHYDLFFTDGSCPPENILKRFMELAENEPGALAVHCKAGLGRTGVLICCYMMKHYGFTVEECLGYIRICRPGSVIGPQQNYLKDMQARMWREGDLYRQRMASAVSSSRSSSASSSDGDSLRNSNGDLPELERRTSPMKSMRSGTTPAIVKNLTRKLGGTSIHGSSSDGTLIKPSGAAYMAKASDKGYDRYGVNGSRGASQGSMGYQRSRVSAVSTSSPALFPPRRDVAYVSNMTASTVRKSTPSFSNPTDWTARGTNRAASDGRSASATDSRYQPRNGLNGFRVTPATPTQKPSSVSRVLAPNGQPRKVPTAMVTPNSRYTSASDGSPPLSPTGSAGFRSGIRNGFGNVFLRSNSYRQ